MYYFIDNWAGDLYEFSTLRNAKKEAKHHTYGHCISIHHKGDIVAWVKPKPRENPLP